MFISNHLSQTCTAEKEEEKNYRREREREREREKERGEDEKDRLKVQLFVKVECWNCVKFRNVWNLKYHENIRHYLVNFLKSVKLMSLGWHNIR